MNNSNNETSNPTDSTIVTYLVEKDLKEKYKKILQNEYNVERSNTKSTRLKYLVFMKYAAVFIFVTGAILLYNNYNTNSVERFALSQIKESTVLGDQTVMRKDHTVSELLRIEANYAFIHNDFAKAAENFEKLEITTVLNDIDNFYLGLSYLKMEKANPKKCIEKLLKLSKDNAFNEEVSWFLGLAYTVDHNKQEARKILQEIVDKKSYQYKNAQLLLEKLN